MNKDFWLGVGCCIGLICFIGAASQTSEDINREQLADIYNFIQRPTFRVVTTTPTISQMKEGEIVIVSTNSTNLVALVKGATVYLTKN